jgi:hypothetical protein
MHACLRKEWVWIIAHIVLLIAYYTQAYITRRQFRFSYRTEIFLVHEGEINICVWIFQFSRVSYWYFLLPFDGRKLPVPASLNVWYSSYSYLLQFMWAISNVYIYRHIWEMPNFYFGSFLGSKHFSHMRSRQSRL